MNARVAVVFSFACTQVLSCATPRADEGQSSDNREALAVGAQCQSPASGLCWPYCMEDDCRRGITANPDAVVSRWRAWRGRHIDNPPVVLETGSTGGKRVWKSDPTLGLYNTTVSEGQAYGLLFSMYFDEQSLFDDLWQFYRGTPSQAFGLMDWCIQQNGTACDANTRGAATDADEDAALALIFACKKVQLGAWAEGRFDYCAEASQVLDNIYEYEVSADGYLLPGDSWSGDAPLNPSYFSPGAYRVFDAFEGSGRWEIVADTSYANIDAIQAAHGGCSKLVHNWGDRAGNPVVPFAGSTDYMLFGWDAARITWRVALDKLWYDSAEARETVDEMGGFFSQVGARNIKPVYDMQGVTTWPYGLNAFFSANAGVAIWAADNPVNPGASCGAASAQASSGPQAAYDVCAVTAEPVGEYDYYNNAWQLLGLMTMSGNTPNVLAIAEARGTGLLAEYFAKSDFSVLNGVTVDSPNFDAALFSPRNASARFSGTLEPRYSETYTFQSPGRGVRLWVDGELVVDSTRGHDSRPRRIALREGFAVPITLEYSKRFGFGRPYVAWQSKSQRQQPIPLSRLRPYASAERVRTFQPDASYQLSLGGSCLDTAGAMSLGACARVPSQVLEPRFLRDGWVMLRVSSGGRCLTARGANLVERPCVGTPAQSFKAYDAGGQLARLINREAGEALAATSPEASSRVGLDRFDAGEPGMRWTIAKLSACGDGVCGNDEGCTSCAADCNCGACGGFCPDGIVPAQLTAPLAGVALTPDAACYSVTGVTGGIWNTTNAPTTKELFLNGAPIPWGPGVGLAGNACVYASQGTMTDWAGFGTF